NSSLVVESGTDNYVSILAPDNAETSILFGNPANNVSGGIVYNNSTNPNGLQFRNNGNITSMVLSKDGNLGVGTSTPTKYKAKISHGNFGLLLENSSTSENWELVTFGNLQLFFNGLLRGTFNKTTGVYTSNSDGRLKTNVRPMTAMLGKIDQLKPATYQFKNATDQQEYNGFIAQDVMKIFPSLVTHNVSNERNLDTYTMDYSGLGVIAIKGIQELQSLAERQKKMIITLEERINKLETSIAAITREGTKIKHQ
ncbi:MAG: tail fiber domain-containing protein, partial [Ferruginibacter sp.]